MLFKYYGPLLHGYHVSYILFVGLFVQYLSTLLNGKLHEDREHIYIFSPLYLQHFTQFSVHEVNANRGNFDDLGCAISTGPLELISAK